jgi:hypothetical protein
MHGLMKLILQILGFSFQLIQAHQWLAYPWGELWYNAIVWNEAPTSEYCENKKYGNHCLIYVLADLKLTVYARTKGNLSSSKDAPPSSDEETNDPGAYYSF